MVEFRNLNLILTMGVFMLAMVFAMPLGALAIQPDAEYLVREKQFGKQWAAEDKLVYNKMAALEKKFGKKPNIIFILADDIGYTELGSYGGGKVRGFSTPNLDRMAVEGMRLTSFSSSETSRAKSLFLPITLAKETTSGGRIPIS